MAPGEEPFPRRMDRASGDGFGRPMAAFIAAYCRFGFGCVITANGASWVELAEKAGRGRPSATLTASPWLPIVVRAKGAPGRGSAKAKGG